SNPPSRYNYPYILNDHLKYKDSYSELLFYQKRSQSGVNGLAL
ncbi:hypothetical protein, partial [uncultured Gammaproteobacteria bacterium]